MNKSNLYLIPEDVFSKYDLTPNEIIFYIKVFTDCFNNGYSDLTNEEYASFVKVNSRAIQKYITKLKKNGLIVLVNSWDKRRFVIDHINKYRLDENKHSHQKECIDLDIPSDVGLK